MRVFISHSHLDKDIVFDFTRLLVDGVGISKDKIFCSIVPGMDIPYCVNIVEEIKKGISDSDVFIPFFTTNYLKSHFCMWELGAAWALSKRHLPVLVPPITQKKINEFPMLDSLYARLDIKSDLDKLLDDFSKAYNTCPTFRLWENYRDKFVEKISLLKELPNDMSKEAVVQGDNNNQTKYKLVAFDLDGTLLQGNRYHFSWSTVWHYLGDENNLRKTYHRRYFDSDGVYSYKEWCEDCVRYYISKGLKKSDIHKMIRDNKIKYANDLKLLLEILKSKGVHTAIISGGIDTYMEYGLKGIEGEFNDIYINKFEYDSRGYLKGVIPTRYDFDGKLAAIDELCKKVGCSRSETVFVGEGYNDLEVAKSDCYTIVYPIAHSDPLFRNEANAEVSETSILAILKYIL